jgi:SAM-dependent methyltransferase
MSELYARFLPHIPKGGRILDAGCGSGRDTLYFVQHGFRVEAFDASAEMCHLASSLTGQTVRQQTFDQVDSVAAFDGVWACASLLHVGRDRIDAVLANLCRALKPGGMMFISFKLRNGEWKKGGRFFNGYDEGSFRTLLSRHLTLRLHSVWISDDVRPQRAGEKWLNALVCRAPEGEP